MPGQHAHPMPPVTAQQAVVHAVVEAWVNPGPVPDYHDQVKAAVTRQWPALAAALEALADVVED